MVSAGKNVPWWYTEVSIISTRASRQSIYLRIRPENKIFEIKQNAFCQTRMAVFCICELSAVILQWCHNGREGVSNHEPRGCLLNRLFGHRSKKTSKLRVTGVCAGNSPVTGEFPAQMASNAENVSIWWRHHVYTFANVRAPLAALNRKLLNLPRDVYMDMVLP